VAFERALNMARRDPCCAVVRGDASGFVGELEDAAEVVVDDEVRALELRERGRLDQIVDRRLDVGACEAA
jgi:hypothetical protein